MLEINVTRKERFLQWKLQCTDKKKTEEDTKKWKDHPRSWIRRSNSDKKSPHYPKQSVDLMQSLSKYQWHFSQNRKNKPEIHMKAQRPWTIAQSWEKQQSWNHQNTWL
jgi:hypothetical protein